MASKEYTLRIKLVCGKCYRELEFNEGSDGDVDLEIQAQLCPDCMKALRNEVAKEVGEKIAKAFHTAMQMQLTDVITEDILDN